MSSKPSSSINRFQRKIQVCFCKTLKSFLSRREPPKRTKVFSTKTSLEELNFRDLEIDSIDLKDFRTHLKDWKIENMEDCLESVQGKILRILYQSQGLSFRTEHLRPFLRSRIWWSFFASSILIAIGLHLILNVIYPWFLVKTHDIQHAISMIDRTYQIFIALSFLIILVIFAGFITAQLLYHFFFKSVMIQRLQRINAIAVGINDRNTIAKLVQFPLEELQLAYGSLNKRQKKLSVIDTSVIAAISGYFMALAVSYLWSLSNFSGLFGNNASPFSVITGLSTLFALGFAFISMMIRKRTADFEENCKFYLEQAIRSLEKSQQESNQQS